MILIWIFFFFIRCISFILVFLLVYVTLGLIRCTKISHSCSVSVNISGDFTMETGINMCFVIRSRYDLQRNPKSFYREVLHWKLSIPVRRESTAIQSPISVIVVCPFLYIELEPLQTILPLVETCRYRYLDQDYIEHFLLLFFYLSFKTRFYLYCVPLNTTATRSCEGAMSHATSSIELLLFVFSSYMYIYVYPYIYIYIDIYHHIYNIPLCFEPT
jgi:hypothetical protein